MKNSILLCAALLTLGACVSHDFGEGKRTNYSCDGGKEFSARDVAGSVEVYAGGETRRLLPNGEGSYTDGALTLTSNGRNSTITGRERATLTGAANGPYDNCQGSPSQSWFPTLW